MHIRSNGFGLAAGALAMAVIGAVTVSPVAIAAPQDSAQGETSGPAAGKMVSPGAATQKQASTQAGAPGAEGKQGAESGAAPKAEGQMKSHQ